MSRLNASIKLVFCCGELVLVVVSFSFIVASALIATGKVVALSFPIAQEMAFMVLALSSSVFLCTCFGCCGAIRQTLRTGCCSGRRMLCLHQALLLTVLVFSISQYEWLNKRERSMALVIADHNSYPEYDAFEKRISKYFDNAYFDSICSDNPENSWFLTHVKKICPRTMSLEYCALSERDKKTCDTSCDAAVGSTEDSQVLMACCPSEDLCNGDGQHSHFSCPYHRCRVGILRVMHEWAAPTKVAIQFVCFLSAMLLVLSCLLICYNPRDEIEVELLKTGVMTEDDVETIRKLKENRGIKSINKEGNKISLKRLDSLSKEQERKENMFSFGSRKRLARISPTPSE